MRYTKLFLFPLFLIFSMGLFGQKTTIQVLDMETHNPVPFSKIADNKGNVEIADIDGKVKIRIDKNAQYKIRFFNYKETKRSGKQLLQRPIILLQPKERIQNYGAVVIHPGENPAIRIIKNVMQHKDANDPLKNDGFNYNSYSKFYATGTTSDSIRKSRLDSIKRIKQLLADGLDSSLLKRSDSSLIRGLWFLKNKYLFLIETGAHRVFSPPNYNKTTITSYNVSGIKKPIFAAMLNQYQSFSFYNNNFKLGPTEYLNPIAPGGIRRYYFSLKDTLFHPNHPNDTTYVIHFLPKRGKNFDGLQGFLYINTNQWAIQRVIASPFTRGKSQPFEVTITQEYKITNHKKWFPKKISTEIKFNNVQLGKYMNLIARGAVYIRDVQFQDKDLKKYNGFNPVAVKVAPDALSDSTTLKKLRGNTASGKEGGTYKLIDSLGKEAHLGRKFTFLKILTTGKLPIGKVSFPLQDIITYNQQEGIRLGLGMETNQRMSRFFKIGGYFAYGLHDKKWKWGGDMRLTFNQQHLIRLYLHYEDDLHERGGTNFYKDKTNLFSKRIYANLFTNRLDRQRYAGLRLSGLIKQNMRLQIFGNYKRYWFTDDYHYLPLFSKNGAYSKFDIAEVGFVFNWNIFERVMILGNQRLSLGTKWPRIGVKFTKGIKGIAHSQYNYYRFNLQIEQDFKIRGVGNLSLLSNSGMTLGNVPLTLMQVNKGTGAFHHKHIAISAPYTFQTMLPAEFFSDRYTALFASFTFLPIKNKTTWFEPLFTLYTSAGIGMMKNKSDHKGFDFSTMEDGYYESGFVVDNLLKTKLFGLGVGLFYRYGPYAFERTADNFFYKLSLHINLFN